MPAVALKEGKVFVKRKHELDDLLKQLDRVTPEAIDLLADTMQDIKQTIKVRIACADKLIDYKVKVSEAINADDLKRAVAEIKATGLNKTLVPDNKSTAPRLDLHTIQKV